MISTKIPVLRLPGLEANDVTTRAKPWRGIGSAVLLVGIVLAAVLIPFLRGSDLFLTNFDAVLQPPSMQFPLGTDISGRDVLGLVMQGLRVSLVIATVAAVIAVAIGTTLGVLAGLVGGAADTLIMRMVDFLMSQNHLLFTLMVAVLVRPVVGGAGAVLLAVGLTHWTSVARIIRAEVLALREQPFIHAAIGIGLNRGRLARKHYGPHLLTSVVLSFLLLFPHAIFHEAALSFLGLGLSPSKPSLGTLVSAGQEVLVQGGWWMVIFPGMAIVLVSMSVGSLGESWRRVTQERWCSGGIK